MQVQAQDSVLSVFDGNTEAYFFDRSGRLFASGSGGWSVRHGLSGRDVARRWKAGRREIRTLSSDETAVLHVRRKLVLEAILNRENAARPDRAEWLSRALAFDPRRDSIAFRRAYRPVGILPPDQYEACVVQVTEGCRWNACRFCSFYRAQPFRVKERSEIRRHVRELSVFFAGGLSLRRSIFLGEAHALTAPLDRVLEAMKAARQELVPRMGPFRGFYSFIDPADSACRDIRDFRALTGAGLRRIYYGLETGEPELRRELGKPGTLEEVAQSVQSAKAAGLWVALILRVGAGGRRWSQRHIEQSIHFLKRLPLQPADIIFLSPLYHSEGTRETPLSSDERDEQMARLRAALSAAARVAPYDIREFVY